MTKPTDPKKPEAPNATDELDEKDLERVAGGTDDAAVPDSVHMKDVLIIRGGNTQKAT